MFGEHRGVKAGAHQANLQEGLASPAGPRLDTPAFQLPTHPEAFLTPTSSPPRHLGKVPPLKRRYGLVLSFSSYDATGQDGEGETLGLEGAVQARRDLWPACSRPA